MMPETFEIKTPGIDVEEIMARIRERVEEKRRRGEYSRYNLSAATALEMDNLRSDDAYLDYYLKTIRRAADVDLGDFEIFSKTFLVGRPVVWLKKIIWKLMKFYTFRLFSQQKDFNARMAGIVQGLDAKYERRLAALEEKIKD
ncbi:MAG: hypothetical protein V1789_10255 [PVC group bacterium]